MSNAALIIVIIVAVIVVAALVVAGLKIARKKQTERLRAQYGPEYDRVVKRSDNPREAEAELREREKRHKKLDLRELEPRQKADFERRWTELQGEFVDDPSGAVRGADHLVVEVMSARGYPVEDFDQRADDLSVSHPQVTQHYREARKIAKANEDGSADTEDLRKAVTSYRSLVKALLTDGDSGGHDRKATSSGHDRSSDHDDAERSSRPDAGRPDTGRSDMGKGDSDTGRNGQAATANGHVRTGESPDAGSKTAGHETSARETERNN
ncbi:MAG TPA: hypothetical protein VL595_13690 [Pseudonocardia sp.]|jgi:hypothetical protein|nr:hypothetical protein [Pseudonocardia sp.]